MDLWQATTTTEVAMSATKVAQTGEAAACASVLTHPRAATILQHQDHQYHKEHLMSGSERTTARPSQE